MAMVNLKIRTERFGWFTCSMYGELMDSSNAMRVTFEIIDPLAAEDDFKDRNYPTTKTVNGVKYNYVRISVQDLLYKKEDYTPLHYGEVIDGRWIITQVSGTRTPYDDNKSSNMTDAAKKAVAADVWKAVNRLVTVEGGSLITYLRQRCLEELQSEKLARVEALERELHDERALLDDASVRSRDHAFMNAERLEAGLEITDWIRREWLDHMSNVN